MRAQSSHLQDLRYDIDVSLDDVRHRLSGSITITFLNYNPTPLEELVLHLYANAYATRGSSVSRQLAQTGNFTLRFAHEDDLGWIKLSDVLVNGQGIAEMRDSLNKEIVLLKPSAAIPTGSECRIQASFDLQIPTSFSRLGHVGESYQITQWYPKLAMLDENGWHPMPYLDIGEFYAPFARYSVTLSLPANYLVAGTGALQTVGEKAWLDSLAGMRIAPLVDFPASSLETKTLEFLADSVHDFAWFADKRFAVRRSEVNLRQRPVTCWSFFTAEQAALWEQANFFIGRSLAFYDSLVGPYPYSAMTAVQAPESRGTGMEYPMITLIGREWSEFALDQVIAHEVGHNWFYGILANDERTYPWLDEGVNSYYEMRYLRRFYPYKGDRFLFSWARRRSDISDPQLLLGELYRSGKLGPWQEYQTNFNYEDYLYGVYYKPAFVLSMMEHAIGKEVMDRAMQQYYDQLQFDHPEPGDFFGILEEACQCSLEWARQLIDSTLLPEFSINAYNAALETGSISNTGNFTGPVEVVAYQDSIVLNSVWVPTFTGDTTISISCSGCNRIQLYRNEDMIDATPADNVLHVAESGSARKKLRVTMLGVRNDPGYTSINMLPAVGWNEYDEGMFGAYLSNLQWPANRFSWHLAPLYSSATRSFVGMGHISWKSDWTGWGRCKLDVSMRSFNYNFDEHYNFYDRYLKIAPRVSLEWRELKSPATNHLSYRWILVEQRYGEGIDFDERIWSRKARNYSVHELIFGYSREGLLGAHDLAVTAHIGHGFARLWGEYNYKVVYNARARRIFLRSFAGWLPWYENPPVNAAFNYSGTSGMSVDGLDYLYDELLVARNETNGVLGQQVFDRDAGLKTLFSSGSSDSWMLGAGFAIDAPFKIPLQFYADGALRPTGKSSISVDFSIGFAILVYRDVLEVYMPVYESSAIRNSDIYQERSGFFERVSFKFNLRRWVVGQI